MLFQVKSVSPLSVQVQGKGYNRDGTVNDFGPVDVVLNSTGGPVEIGAVQFDDLRLGGNLTVDDKFVINVAAKAGNTNAAASHGDTTYSDSNVAIEGNPFNLRGSTMEYRFDQGVENGQSLNLLGFFVHPLTGGTDTGVMTGSIVMDVSGAGFTAGTQTTGTQGASVDFNFYGKSDSKAGSLLTHYYFNQLNSLEQPSEVIHEIKYDPSGQYNSSILFDLAELKDDSAIFHVQAHIYDSAGNYRYMEDDYVELGKTNDGMNLFTAENFPGLKFDTFSFEDMSKLTKGDRFVVNTGADMSGHPDADEIIAFSASDYGSMYPASWRFEDGVLDNAETTLKFYQIEPKTNAATHAGNEDVKDGKIFDGEMTFKIGSFHGGTAAGVKDNRETPVEVDDAITFSTVRKEGVVQGIANKYSYLRDIANFYDASTGFMLENDNTLTISYKDTERLITLTPNQTVRELLDNINRVIYEEFEQKDFVDETDRFKFANYVNYPDETGTTETVRGSFVLRSAVTGEEGEIRLSGNQEILDVLEMIETQQAEENLCNISVFDATSNEEIFNDTIRSGDDARIINDRLALEIDSDFGVDNTTFNELDETFEWGNSNNNEFDLHIKDNSLKMHIGANKNQDAQFGIGTLSTESLDLERTNVKTLEDSEEAIESIDHAQRRVVDQQSQLGAIQNRLEKSLTVSENTVENIINAESRIRDADMAKEALLLAKQQILVQSSQAMLSQANQLLGSGFEGIRRMIG